MKMSYSTSDWGLALTLYSLGHPLIGIQWQDADRAEFLFEKSDSTEQVIEAYWHRQLKVEPQAFLVNQKLLKSRLYSEK